MKFKLLSLAALIAVLPISCSRESIDNHPAPEQTGTILLSVIPDGAGTKAGTPDVSSLDYETRVNKVDIYVFDENGLLNLHHWTDMLTDEIPLSVSTGEKEIWAVLNGPTLGNIIRVSDLQEAIISLEDNQATASGGTFTMAGSNTCTVSAAGSVPCNITAARFVARVRLTKVSVNLPTSYGSVTFPSVMLSNVVADRRIDGNKGLGVWYNKKGRTDSGVIINGNANAKASAPAATFREWNKTAGNGSVIDLTGEYMCFYGFENLTPQDKLGSNGEFIEERTRLVLTAVISGQTYYYPVTIPGLTRNKAYEVELTITGLGSDDPDIVPQRGDAEATVIIKPWGEGSVITETI